MIEIAIAATLVAAVWALAWWDTNRRKLNQRTTDFTALADKHDALVKDHGETIAAWQRRFEVLEQRQDRGDAKLENAIRNGIQPAAGRNPLGAAYNVRG